MKYHTYPMAVCLVALLIVPSMLVGCTKEQQTTGVPSQKISNEILATPKLLAVIGSDEQADSGEGAKHGSEMSHGKQNPQIVVAMNKYGKGVAYVARVGTQMHVVHNGISGKFYDNIESNRLIISEDGQRVAYTARKNEKWTVVVDGIEKGIYDETGGVEFSPDGRHVAYEAKIGDKWYVYADDVKNAGATAYYDKPVFVGGADKLLFVENTIDVKGAVSHKLFVSDLKFNSSFVSIIHPEYLTVSADRTMVAAVKKEGTKMRVLTLWFDKPNIVTGGPLFDEVTSNIVVSKDGKSVAYLAKIKDDSFLVLNDKAERLPKGEFPLPPVLRPDGAGASVALYSGDQAYLYQGFSAPAGKPATFTEVGDLAYSDDGRLLAYIVKKNDKYLIFANGNEGPPFDRVIAPKFSPDGKHLIYSARKDGKRFVVIADSNGKTIKQLSGFDRIFETAFTRDGKSVAYGAMLGKKLLWQVETL